MPDPHALIAQAYAAFNSRNISAALSLMTETVSWPKAFEGGRAEGKDQIRAYWTRQWQDFDPHVEPLELLDRDGGKTHVRVHQLVRSLSGDILSDFEVWHIFTLANGLIKRMDLPESSPHNAEVQIQISANYSNSGFTGSSVTRFGFPPLFSVSPAHAFGWALHSTYFSASRRAFR